MKICIFGGGAIGGHIAAHLAREGAAEVSVVARGATLQAIREHGIIVETPTERFAQKVRATDHAAELGPQDYVFLTLKAHQLDAALDDVAHLIGPDTVLLPPTTGLPHYFFGTGEAARLIDPSGRQAALMPDRRVLGVVYWIGAHSSAPGVVSQDGAKAGCPLGELDGSVSPRAAALAERLTAAGIPSKVTPNVQGAIWMKFVNSLCWNPVAILTLARICDIDQSDCRDLIAGLMDEADAGAKAIGIEIPQLPERRIALTATAGSHKMSMLQDLEHGRMLELDVLCRSIEAVQRLSGIEMPRMNAVLALARLRASQHHQMIGGNHPADRSQGDQP
ncbi:ketopantoate reductase family protein [Paracoccus sp. J55]|uniref:ketopantoate reductase family protein n=1 Tax=Paracoccus sp. J55 TaxID=935849 RepID=UPI0004B7C376|nr:2-dehydropantoate 2-reductase [Paracoccus sp. J55]